ncbi:hypothetical protein LCGC14_2324260 [marine sediment metagenome]|uniref:Uncharacterized protein n=1 Tax=marine sediment metagenome TaxID=412755 RepID=A0A0F9CGW5_9ZZZZ
MIIVLDMLNGYGIVDFKKVRGLQTHILLVGWNFDMPIVVFYVAIFFILILFFLVMPYFVSLPTVMSVLIIFLIAFCSCGLGYWLAEIMHRWKNKIEARHAKRFYWYRDMGLFESAYLVEPKLAKHHWHWGGMRK